MYLSDDMKEPLDCLASIIKANYIHTLIYDIIDPVLT